MNAENLCTLSGCKASCCHDMEIPWYPADGEVQKTFPSVATIQSADQMISNGVYTIESPSGPTVFIVGRCPHNNPQTHNCDIHTKRPTACKKLRFLGEECTDARARDGNSEIHAQVYAYGAE